MATIYEVSKLAGVSLATVSRVMNNTGNVSEATKAAVVRAMKELNYRPNAMARSLAANRSDCVGILVSELHGPIFGAMVSGIEAELRQAGKIAIFACGHSDAAKEKEGIRFLSGMNVDALILHVEALSDEYLLELHEDPVTPLVVINRDIRGMKQACISLDNLLGGSVATRAMIDLGHQRIACISGPLSWEDARERLAGHRKALREAGLEVEDNLIVEGDYHEQGGSRAMQTLFERDREFTAVVCANDEMAAGAMDVIRSRGLDIPGDISVIGYDNVRWARYLYPKLTTVNYPVGEMGQMAARWILKNVYGDESQVIQNRFLPQLVYRDSAGMLSS